MTVLEHVAGNLRRLRAEADLSQQALAEASGVSRRMLVSVESGDANVSLNTLDRLAEALGVTFSDLVREAGQPRDAQVRAVAWAGTQAGSHGTLLSSCQARHETELWQWQLMPGDSYAAQADPAGWKEMLLVTQGELVVEHAGQAHHLRAGDVLVLDSSASDYAYCNVADAPVRFIRNVVH